ncbi:MAG: hypothetical protein IJD57_04470 [Candidatus Gastranaerophilales bacterium]|nr:hypothetical protein [Candidatus Gastranaerophilales bacterium]
MEISNRFGVSNFNKIAPKQLANSFNISTRGNIEENSGNDSLAKAKIALDNISKKPLSYEEKLELLISKGIESKEAIRQLMQYNDSLFKKAIMCLDLNMDTDEIDNYIRHYDGDEKGKKIMGLVKAGLPYDFAKSAVTYSRFDDEKLETLKKSKFDFSQKRRHFKISTSDIYEILKEKKFEQFCELQKENISANVAIAAIDDGENIVENTKKVAQMELGLPNDTKCAYYLLGVMPKNIKKIVEICKKYNLNPQEYSTWSDIARTRELERSEELLDLGVDFKNLAQDITLDDEKIKEAIAFSKENEIDFSEVLEIYQSENLEEEQKAKSLEYLKNKGISSRIATQLNGYDDKIAQDIVKYISLGLTPNNANILANYELDEETKAAILALILDGTFEYVSDAKEYIGLDLNDEQKEQAKELVKLKACIPFAKFCIDNPRVHQEVLDLINSGYCEDLQYLYGYSEDAFLSEAELIRLGIPKDNLSLNAYGLTDEHKELLALGVPYETVREIKLGEVKLNSSEDVKKLLKAGVEYKTACLIAEKLPLLPYDIETILEIAGKEVSAEKIGTLAKIQNENEHIFQKEDMEIVREFAKEVEDLSDFETAYKFGFFNEKALENLKEIRKRGLEKYYSAETIALSQIDFKNSREIDRACELLKRRVNIAFIPYFIGDDNAFLTALSEKKYSKDCISNEKSFPFFAMKFYKDGMNLKDMSFLCERSYYTKETLESLTKFLTKGHDIKTAKKLAEYSGGRLTRINPEEDEKQELEATRDYISDLILKGGNYEYISDIFYRAEDIQRLEKLLEKGYKINVAEKIVAMNISENNHTLIDKIKEFETANLNEHLKRLYPNPMLTKSIDELYDFKNYSPYELKKLVTSDLTLEDIKKSANIFIKSPLKQAMKQPNMYLSGIPSEDTEKIDGKYPVLSEEKMEGYQKDMTDFFKNRMTEITRMLKYIDVDTFNQMMDKRTTTFSAQLEQLNKMDSKHFELASKLMNCRKENGKLLSAKEKINLAKISLYHQLGYLDTDYLEKFIKDGKVDIEELNAKIFEKLTEVIGLTPEEVKKIPKEKFNFDEEYMYLLLRTQASADFLWFKEQIATPEETKKAISDLEDLLNAPDEEIIHNGLTREGCKKMLELLKRAHLMEEKDIYQEFSKINPFSHVDCSIQDIARFGILYDFKDMITNGNSEIAFDNSKTKAKFKKLGLDYNTWLNYNKTEKFDLNNVEYQVKLWDRLPQKDLFMGNRTSCCTAVIDGANGKATPIYLANTAFNVVELQDMNGNILGMSRIFVGKVDNEPSIIVENIELNNAFLKGKTDEDLSKISKNMFDYIKEYGKQVSNGKEMKVYFSKNYTHVPTQDFEKEEKNIEFIGNISSDTIYLNCAPGWIIPEELQNTAYEIYSV